MEVEMEVETWGAAVATFEEGDCSAYLLLSQSKDRLDGFSN